MKSRGARAAGGRADALLIEAREQLKSIPESLETWADPEIAADFPREQWPGCDDNAAVLLSSICSTEYIAA
jgi:hypothetical protein